MGGDLRICRPKKRQDVGSYDTYPPRTKPRLCVLCSPWRPGTSVDGIFDSTTESLSLTIPGATPGAASASTAGAPAPLARGTHTLSLRVADSAGNVGSATTTFLTP